MVKSFNSIDLNMKQVLPKIFLLFKFSSIVPQQRLLTITTESLIFNVLIFEIRIKLFQKTPFHDRVLIRN